MFVIKPTSIETATVLMMVCLLFAYVCTKRSCFFSNGASTIINEPNLLRGEADSQEWRPIVVSSSLCQPLRCLLECNHAHNTHQTHISCFTHITRSGTTLNSNDTMVMYMGIITPCLNEDFLVRIICGHWCWKTKTEISDSDLQDNEKWSP